MKKLMECLTIAEKRILAAHCILFLIVILPFITQETLPLADYNNHLARAYVAHYPEQLSGVYRVQWQLAPYLADIVPQLFISLLGIYTAGKVYFVSGLLLSVAGVVLISRQVHGRISAATLLILPFLFNFSTMIGFVNYSFAMGFALISFYLWLRLERWRGNWIFAALLFSVNFLLHALSYGLLILLIGIYALWPAKPTREWLKRAMFLASAVVPQLIMFVFSPHEAAQEGQQLGDFWSRAHALISPAMFTYHWQDFTLYVATAFLYVTRIIAIDRRFYPVVIIFILLAPFIPYKILGISWLDVRLPVFLALLLPAISYWQTGHSKAVLRIAVAALSLLCIARYADHAYAVTSCGQMYDAYLKALRETPIDKGATIATFSTGDEICALPRAFAHANSLAIIEHGAFVPTLFTLMPPVKPDAAYDALAKGLGKPLSESDLFFKNDSALADYEYVIWFHDRPVSGFRSSQLEVLQQTGFFTFFRNLSYEKAAP